MKAKRFFIYNLIVFVVAFQIVLLVNYWFFIFQHSASANINETIVYQGQLADPNGNPVSDGVYHMRFSVYNAYTNGTLLWTETWNGSDQDPITGGVQGSTVSVTGGVFSIELNSLCGDWIASCASNGGVSFNEGVIYLQVELDVDQNGVFEEIFSPRKRFSSAAYTHNADNVSGVGVGSSGSAIPLFTALENAWSGVNSFVAQNAGSSTFIVQGVTSQSANFLEITLVDEMPSYFSSEGTLATTEGVVTNQVTRKSGVYPPSMSNPSLVSYSTFNEGAGAVAYDSKGAYDATITNATWQTGGYFSHTDNQHLSFDGTGDYLTLGNITELNAVEAFTVEMWAKQTTLDQSKTLFSKYDSSTNHITIETNSNGNMYISIRDGVSEQRGYFDYSQIITADTWFHLGVVFDGAGATNANKLQVYINGTQVTLSFEGTLPTLTGANEEPVLIGRRSTLDGSYDWAGGIDHFALYSSALTAKEIRSHAYTTSVQYGYTPSWAEEGIIAYWNIDEGSGTALYDKITRLTGTISGATWVGNGVFGYSGDNALSFTGTNYAQLGTNTLDAYQEGSIELWVTFDTVSTAQYPFSYATSASDAENIYIATSTAGTYTTGGRLMFRSYKSNDNTNDNILESSTALQTGQWYHVVIASDGTQYKMYLNGQEEVFNVGRGANDGDWFADLNTNHTHTIDLGRLKRFNIINTFGGDIDNVILYDRALSAQEVAYRYSQQQKEKHDGFVFDTQEIIANDRHLISFQNNDTEVSSITGVGILQTQGIKTSGESNITLESDEVSLSIESSENHTTSLTEWKNGTNEITTSVTANGDIIAIETITGEEVITELITSSATLVGKTPTTEDVDIVGYWKMDEGSGSTLLDESVNSNNGTITGTTYAGIGAFGYDADDSITFNGTSSDVITVPSHSSLDITGEEISVALWMKTTATNDNRPLVSKSSATQNNYNLRTATNAQGLGKMSFVITTSGGNTALASTSTVNDGEWHHVVGVYDGIKMYIYIDGEEDASVAKTGTLVTVVSDLVLGRYSISGSTAYYNGSMDNVVIYKRALTPDEVEQQYLAGIDGNSVGVEIDTQEEFIAQDAKIISVRTGGTEQLFIGGSVLGLTGVGDKEIRIDRIASASSAGKTITLQAGSATFGGTNLDGGSLYLSGGIATGNGVSTITLQNAVAGNSGTTDRSPASRLVIAGDGSLQVAEGSEVRFYNTTYYTGITAPTPLSGNQVWTLPSADGGVGQIITTSGSGELSFSQKRKLKTVTTSSNYTVATDVDAVFATQTVDITLPNPSSVTGKTVLIKRVNAGTVTVTSNGGALIDGNSSAVLNVSSPVIQVVSSGSHWFSF